MVQTQAEPRIKIRVPCDIGTPETRQGGMILNLSQRGLFVQTLMSAPSGSLVTIDLKETPGEGPIPLQAAVVWKRMVPRNLVHVSQGGLGLRIEESCPAYEEYFRAILGRRVDRPEFATAPARQRGFRIRVKLVGEPRSRTLVLSAASEEEAREQALTAVGEGWTILEIEQD
jgi:hypothetical protein